MKSTHPTTWMLAALLLAAAAEGYQNKSGLAVDLQAAMQRETVQGDLRGALKQYERILSRAGSDREIAARALLRIGQCHEKLGSAEARKVYERLLREFGDQKDASEAKSRLAALGGNAAPPEDRLLYSSAGTIGDARPSRDGRFVAFPCERAICVLETATGAVKTIVPAPANRTARLWRPMASPDGSRVVYTHFADEARLRTGDLRISGVNPIGDSLLLAGSSETQDYFAAVDWSADGKHILVARINRNGRGLFVIPAAGGQPREIETPEFNWWTGRRISRISPDGKWIAYPSATPDQSTRGYVPTDVRVMPAAGGASTPVMTGPGHDYPLGWLANGDLIVASERSGKPRVYRQPISAGKPQGDPQLLGVDIGDRPNADNVLGVAANGAIFVVENEELSDLYSFRSGDGPMQKLPTGFQAGRQVFSPDGSKLAYTVGGGGVNENSIVVRDMASGKERMITGKIPSVLRLTWYPNGQAVLAICNTGNYGRRPMFRINIVNGEIRPTADLVDLASWHNPAILADNRTLLYNATGDNRPGGRYAGLDLETGAVRTIISPRAEGYSVGVFGVSPDRKQIVYVEGEKQSEREFLMISSIENPTPRTLCESPKCFPRTPFFGAGDREIIFWSGDRRNGEPRGLWRIPVEGGEPRLLRDVKWTMDGPAIHPSSGEIVVGVSAFRSRLRSKRLQ